MPLRTGRVLCLRYDKEIVLTTPRLLVFDLDGTLIDSRIDLCNSVNAMLSHYGRDTLAEPTIASYIGVGASALVRRAFAHAHLVADEPDPYDETFIVEATSWFIDWYRVHKLDYTYVYPGVVESLSFLREKHPKLPMAVLTNKPVHPSRDICRHFKLDRYCYQIYGGNSFNTKKPNPEGLLTLIAEAETLTLTAISRSEVVMIGDSHVDVETARACGAWSLGCTFGLSPESLAAAGPDISVDHASDWPRALNLL